MTKTISLPSGRYKLTKQTATVKTSSNVHLGAVYTGSLNEPTVVVGECFYFITSSFSNQMRTSIVEDFELLPNNQVSIKTMNSVYLLEEI